MVAKAKTVKEGAQREGGEAVTPNEAVDKLPYTRRSRLLALLEAVATTATENETRRCADYVKGCRVTDGKVFDLRLATIANDILRTGGLKVEG